MSAFREDLAHAVRRLKQRPGFTLVAAATLAVGIGGATALFSVAHAVILRPLPYTEPDRLALVWQSDRERGQPFVEMSYPAFRDWRASNPAFEDLAGMPSTNQSWTLGGQGEPVELVGRLVSWSFFDVLGVSPALGRTLLEEDDRRGAAHVVVLSHRLWRARFASDPGIVGRAIVLDRGPFTVVGVMPEGFAYPAGVELWTPLVPGVNELAEQPGVWWMSALGRLKPGVSLAQARRDMTAFASSYNRETYQEPGITAVVTPLAEAVFGPTRPTLLALLGGVGLVLLVACANVAALQLVQVDERSAEMALRLALGASPARLGRGLLAESLVLGGLGGGLGVVGALAGVPLLVALSPREVPRLREAALDTTTLAFALVVTLAAAAATALAPIVAGRHRSLREALQGGTRSVAAGGSRMRTALVAGEVALALVLLVGAGLLVRCFVALRDVPLGFHSTNLLAFDAGASEKSYPELAQQRRYVEDLVARVQALPGVESAAAVTLRPLWGSTVGMDWRFAVEGQSAPDADRNPLVNFETVTPDYFRTMGIPLTRGRAFDARDRDGQPGVVIVSDALARRYWPGQDPIGKRLKIPLPPTAYHDAWLTVVGVAGDARYRELTATRLDLYMPHRQSDHRPHHVVVRTRGDTTGLSAAILGTLRALDPEQPAPRIVSMTDVVHEALAGPRFAARVLTAFAIVALSLAALGLYGLIAYAVGRRTREIGVRVTLGARPLDVARLVVREGLWPAALGVALGLAGALAAAHLVSKLLFGVGPTDAVTLASAAVLLLLVAVLASALPAGRALRVQPSVTLREP
jgi:putative ABC transport system permease protein